MKRANVGLQLRRAISIQAEGKKLLEKDAIAPSAARLCYANSFVRHWLSSLSVLYRDYQPFCLPLFHNPCSYSLSQLARWSVTVFIVFNLPLDNSHRNIGFDE